MLIHLKEGVDWHEIDHRIYHAVAIAAEVWKGLGKPTLTITSGRRPATGRRSWHWYGCAVDLRIWGLDDPAVAARRLAAALGDDYDVVLESDHIHVEFDPDARKAR